MLRANYARELLSWAFLPIMLGAVEGGTVSIVVKKHFAALPEVSASELNFAVAAVTAAPAMANITSFLWAGLAHGRPKVPFIAALQIATAAMVLLLGLCSQSVTGLAVFTVATILARAGARSDASRQVAAAIAKLDEEPGTYPALRRKLERLERAIPRSETPATPRRDLPGYLDAPGR